MSPSIFLLILVIVPLAFCARDADRVTYFPWVTPPPSFNHYAGYLNATDGKRLFYWFVESENDPANDPLVLWLNGGPGCSSLTGFLIELGPWRVTPDGQNLTWFDDRWNKIANIIFMESPAGVGYSYDDNGEYRSNDDLTAHYNHMALKDFLAGFPEFSSNAFYVTGESYAGVYVPTLSALVADDSQFNFKGFAVGNAVTDRGLMTNAMVPFEWARGLIATESWQTLLDECCGGSYSKACDFDGSGNILCNLAMTEISHIQWRLGLNPYNLYQPCFGGVPDARGVIEETEEYIKVITPGDIVLPSEQYDKLLQFHKELKTHKQIRASIPCSDTSDRETFLNNPEVKTALHVPETVHPWEACSSRVSLNYTQQYRDVTQFYNYIINKNQSHQILVYNGDLDMACNHLGDHWFMERLQLEPRVSYQEWFYTHSDDSRQIAGFGEQWKDVTFVTVLGAGHFVPTDSPRASYKMWESYLNGSTFWAR